MKQFTWLAAAKAALPVVAAVTAFGVGAGCGIGGLFDPLIQAVGGQPAAAQTAQTTASAQGEATADPLPYALRTGQQGELRVRVSNGVVEWSSGSGWHSAGTLDGLSAADPYTPAAVWQEYPSPQAVKQNPEAAQPPQLSFVEAAVPTPTPKPTPVPVVVAPPTVVSGGGGGGAPSGGGGGGGGGGAPSGGGGGGGAPAAPVAPVAPAAPSGGDGEDIGWSGDVLD